MRKQGFVFLLVLLTTVSVKADPSLNWAMANVFRPSLSNMLGGAIAFTEYFYGYSSAVVAQMIWSVGGRMARGPVLTFPRVVAVTV